MFVTQEEGGTTKKKRGKVCKRTIWGSSAENWIL